MSFLDVNLNEVKELNAVPEGEYELQLTKCELRTVTNENSSYNGAQFLLLTFDIPGEADSKSISHTIFLPRDVDDDKTKNNRLRQLKYFCDAFGIDYSSGIDLDDIANGGYTGWAMLKVEEDPEYGEQNRIRRFVTAK